MCNVEALRIKADIRSIFILREYRLYAAIRKMDFRSRWEDNGYKQFVCHNLNRYCMAVIGVDRNQMCAIFELWIDCIGNWNVIMYANMRSFRLGHTSVLLGWYETNCYSSSSLEALLFFYHQLRCFNTFSSGHYIL